MALGDMIGLQLCKYLLPPLNNISVYDYTCIAPSYWQTNAIPAVSSQCHQAVRPEVTGMNLCSHAAGQEINWSRKRDQSSIN